MSKKPTTLHRLSPGESEVDFLRRQTDHACRTHYVYATGMLDGDVELAKQRYYEWRRLLREALDQLGEALS